MGDLEDRVILDNMDDLGRPQGSYPESFVSLSLFLAEISGFVVMLKKRSRQTDTQHQTLEEFNIDILIFWGIQLPIYWTIESGGVSKW